MKVNLIILVLSGLILQKIYAEYKYTCYYDDPSSLKYKMGKKVRDCSQCPLEYQGLNFIKCNQS